jgi:20S proteasome alpha/beta subunit
MTVCIAAICENDTDSPKIVLASDRMITFQDIIQFEHELPKLEEVAPNCVVATAGTATLHTELLRNAKIPKTDTIQPIREIAQRIKDSFDKARKEEIENIVLKRYGFDNFESFYKMQSSLSNNLSDEIIGEITDYEFDLQILIAGIDESGPHIYKIDVDNVMMPFDALGYEGAGIGFEHSRTTFFSSSYTDKFPLSKALYTVYKAKNIAEKAPGVGKATDFWLIKKSGEKISIEKNLDEILKNIAFFFHQEQEAVKNSVDYEFLDKRVSELKLY